MAENGRKVLCNGCMDDRMGGGNLTTNLTSQTVNLTVSCSLVLSETTVPLTCLHICRATRSIRIHYFIYWSNKALGPHGTKEHRLHEWQGWKEDDFAFWIRQKRQTFIRHTIILICSFSLECLNTNNTMELLFESTWRECAWTMAYTGWPWCFGVVGLWLLFTSEGRMK